VAAAGWTEKECEEAWIFAGTSRGNAAELFGHTAFRRPVKRFAASNTLPSEIPAALSIELGARGPWQLLSNACAAGLDALGMAWQAVSSGMAPRALVVAVELPLIPELLQAFHDSGLLAKTSLNQPYHDLTNGLNPAEAVAAITLEPASDKPALAEMVGYWTSSDAHHSLSVPENGHGIRKCLEAAQAAFPQSTWGGICPHATGTAAQGKAEQLVMRELLNQPLPLTLLKPFTGHSLGASGLLEVALLCSFLERHELPPTLNSAAIQAIEPGQIVLKAASGMGGHNALAALRAMPVAQSSHRA
jgi:3-oxoacyl-[acyl-carrier-protein] synthase II